MKIMEMMISSSSTISYQLTKQLLFFCKWVFVYVDGITYQIDETQVMSFKDEVVSSYHLSSLEDSENKCQDHRLR